MTTPSRDPRVLAAIVKGTVQIKCSHLAVWITHFGTEHQGDEEMMAHYTAVSEALEDCMAACDANNDKMISSPTRRRASEEIHAIEKIRIATIGSFPKTPQAWASLFTFLDAAIWDVVCTWEGGEAECWTSLGLAIEGLAKALMARFDDDGKAEVAGWSIYEKTRETIWML